MMACQFLLRPRPAFRQILSGQRQVHQSTALVSTLNALDGSISSNMAIVPTSNGSIDAYASGATQLILDLSSYFAP
jgi:hypothetical protein